MAVLRDHIEFRAFELVCSIHRSLRFRSDLTLVKVVGVRITENLNRLYVST